MNEVAKQLIQALIAAETFLKSNDDTEAFEDALEDVAAELKASDAIYAAADAAFLELTDALYTEQVVNRSFK